MQYCVKKYSFFQLASFTNFVFSALKLKCRSNFNSLSSKQEPRVKESYKAVLKYLLLDKL